MLVPPLPPPHSAPLLMSLLLPLQSALLLLPLQFALLLMPLLMPLLSPL